ncbi:MAG TPA: hypothetical protein V6D33_19335 [Cyanophyceae cyanobacterium]
MYKNPPPATPKYIFPPHQPNDNYIYFENCENHPFLANTEKFQMVNAWWLADATLAAYLETLDSCKKAFSATGLEVEQITQKNTQCYIAYNPSFVIITFRGTRLNNLQNLLNDIQLSLNCSLIDFEDNGCVHQGFKNGLIAVWDELYLRLKELCEENPQRTFWFTGHSRGGAIATLAAQKTVKTNSSIDVRGVYTFGSLCLGDQQFKNSYLLAQRTYRFVNNNDLISRLLSIGIYPHAKLGVAKYYYVGNLKYIASNHQIFEDSNFCDRLADNFEGSFKHLYEITKHFNFNLNWEDLEIPLAPLSNHAPIYYAIHIWNYYEKHFMKA